jgi:hypothetical protein
VGKLAQELLDSLLFLQDLLALGRHARSMPDPGRNRPSFSPSLLIIFDGRA